MEELRVPKKKRTIEVVLPGGAVRRVEVFLAEFSDHGGPERLIELLNGAGEFFPAFDLESKQMSFVNRSALAQVWISADQEVEELAEQHTIPTEHEVEITLIDNSQLRGLVTYVLPPENARLIDYLSAPSPFFRVHQGDRIALVHKRQVARIVIL